jgi:hypothetical protein
MKENAVSHYRPLDAVACNAILAGLRLLQRDLERGCVGDDIMPILVDGMDSTVPDSEYLENLCERINLGALCDDTGCVETPEVGDALLSPAIDAEAWPDDKPFSVKFKANHYFANADADHIIALACESDWALDYPADWVVEYTATFNPDVRRIFDYLSVTDKGGFECSVDGDQAMAWLQQHRPGVWARILCELNAVRVVQAEEAEVKGRWDWICDDRGEACDMSFETEAAAALDAVEWLGLKESGDR